MCLPEALSAVVEEEGRVYVLPAVVFLQRVAAYSRVSTTTALLLLPCPSCYESLASSLLLKKYLLSAVLVGLARYCSSISGSGPSWSAASTPVSSHTC